MKRIVLIILFTAIAACSSETPDDEPPTANLVADRAEVKSAPVKLSKADLLRVCRGGAAFRNGRKVDGIKTRTTDDEIVRLSFVRDDGKPFQFDCMTEGDVLRFRMMDYAGPRTGLGAWSGQGSHLTFKLLRNEIEFTEAYGPGDAVTERIKI